MKVKFILDLTRFTEMWLHSDWFDWRTNLLVSLIHVQDNIGPPPERWV